MRFGCGWRESLLVPTVPVGTHFLDALRPHRINEEAAERRRHVFPRGAWEQEHKGDSHRVDAAAKLTASATTSASPVFRPPAVR